MNLWYKINNAFRLWLILNKEQNISFLIAGIEILTGGEKNDKIIQRIRYRNWKSKAYAQLISQLRLIHAMWQCQSKHFGHQAQARIVQVMVVLPSFSWHPLPSRLNWLFLGSWYTNIHMFLTRVRNLLWGSLTTTCHRSLWSKVTTCRGWKKCVKRKFQNWKQLIIFSTRSAKPLIFHYT